MIDLDRFCKEVQVCSATGHMIGIGSGEFSELITRLRQAEKDAARYRWLRDDADGHQLRGCMELNGEGWDAAVDRVMQCK